MNDVKSWIKSKTIWGILIMLSPIISQCVGFDFGVTINEIVEIVSASVGGSLAIYGRIKARTRISTKIKLPAQ